MEQCLFCGIVAGKIPCKKVYEDDHSVGFLDINPRNPGHTLVIPKKHFGNIFEMSEKEAGSLFESVRKVAAMVKAATNSHGISIAQSNGQAAGQVVQHAHVHIIPRFANDVGAGIECFLQPKKLDDASMDKIASSIKSASPHFHKLERQEKPEKPEKKPKSEDKSEEVEDVDFNF